MTATVETATEYTLNELMCVLAAREIKDGDVVFVGIGLPNLACNLARATHAPNMTLIYESGAVGAVPDRVPPSIGDPALVTGSLMVTSMADVFQSFLQNGKIQVGFLGGAQVDKSGNINTTVVGPYDAPKVRLPGSGGACEGYPSGLASHHGAPSQTAHNAGGCRGARARSGLRSNGGGGAADQDSRGAPRARPGGANRCAFGRRYDQRCALGVAGAPR